MRFARSGNGRGMIYRQSSFLFLFSSSFIIHHFSVIFSDQSIGVEDQDDAAIAQFGRAGDAANLYQRIVDGAHDDFALTENAIYSDACGARAAADDESVKSPRRTSVKCSSHSAK